MGLAIDKSSGRAVQNTSYSREWIPVRTTGIIPNAETKIHSLIDISKYSVGCLYCQFTLGSLTSANIYPKFMDNRQDWESQMCVLGESLASPVMTYSLLRVDYLLNRNGNFHFIFPLPCAKWMNIYTASTGTTTGSDLLAWIGLGNGSPFYRVNN